MGCRCSPHPGLAVQFQLEHRERLHEDHLHCDMLNILWDTLESNHSMIHDNKPTLQLLGDRTSQRGLRAILLVIFCIHTLRVLLPFFRPGDCESKT